MKEFIIIKFMEATLDLKGNLKSITLLSYDLNSRIWRCIKQAQIAKIILNLRSLYYIHQLTFHVRIAFSVYFWQAMFIICTLTKMSQPEDLSPTAPPHNRFSYRSFSSNQIMSDLSKLCEEEDFPNSPRWNSTVGGKNDFPKDDFRMPRDNSTRTSFDNLNKQKVMTFYW